jgi:hypothetical protein
MRCLNCPSTAEGYAVIPGVGEAGEIRFYCDRCARNHRVKMRYWDGRDLDVGGWREKPDLGKSFRTLIFGFDDILRMRREDLEPVVPWIDDEELALALVGSDMPLLERFYSVLPLGRVRRVRELLERPEPKTAANARTPEEARDLIVSLIQRL